MTVTLQELYDHGALNELDVHFAEMLGRTTGCTDPLALLGAAVATHAVSQGHVCADLDAIVAQPPHDGEGNRIPKLRWPSLDAWKEALRAAPFVSDEPAAIPLLLENDRLYLARYFAYERVLARALLARAIATQTDVDRAALDAGVKRLFPLAHTEKEEQQARAARSAVMGRLAVISGGPGTGKTTTVARILALIVEQEHAAGREKTRVELLAPTGKAAQRLGESIAGALGTLDLRPEIAEQIPREAKTIHRALGVLPYDPTRFRHDREDPLTADVVLVDEASMVDLSLMARLVDAVPLEARLIFLGDRDQLASVEAGAIFGDVCLAGGEPTSPLAPSTVHLTYRWRFRADSAIGALAEAIRDGRADDAIAQLDASPAEEPPVATGDEALPLLGGGGPDTAPDGVVRVAPPASGTPIAAVADTVVAGYRAMLEAPTPEKALEHLNDFRVLCAHRRGRFGVEKIGDAIERLLIDAGLVPSSRRYGQTTDAWYPGQPVMVTQNDYQLDLFNGDVGITMPAPGEPDRLRVWFATADGVRDVQPARLPPHETCFAMTIHKSQGSEFGEVVVVLPEKPSPIGTRELLYTGVTRARRRVTVLGGEDVLRDAVERRIQRASGLGDVLQGGE